jgi:hypothetical protein
VVEAQLGTAEQLLIVEGSLSGTCDSGDGGGVHVTMVNEGEFAVGTEEVSVAEVAVRECAVPLVASERGNAAAGCGGGVFLDVHESISFGYQFTNVQFRRNAAWKGRDVYLLATELAEAVVLSKFNFAFASGAERLGSLMGSEEAGGGASAVELFSVLMYTAETIYVGSGGQDDAMCGTRLNGCESLNYAMQHLVPSDDGNRLLFGGTALLLEPVTLSNVEVKRRSESSSASVDTRPLSLFVPTAGSLLVAGITTSDSVTLSFLDVILATDLAYPLISSTATLNVQTLSFEPPASERTSGYSINYPVFFLVSGSATILNCSFGHYDSSVSLFSLAVPSGDICAISSVRLTNTSFVNIAVSSSQPVIASLESLTNPLSFTTSWFLNCTSALDAGSVLSFHDCDAVTLRDCTFDLESLPVSASIGLQSSANEGKEPDFLCQWNGSLLLLSDTTAELETVRIRNASNGALAVSGGTISMKSMELEGNSAGDLRFPSVQRNILCDNAANLEIESIMGTDRHKADTSLWIRNVDCNLTGLPLVYLSELFVPFLSAAELVNGTNDESASVATIRFHGHTLVACGDLAFDVRIVFSNETEGPPSAHPLQETVNETDAVGLIPFSEADLPQPGGSVVVRLTFTGHGTPQRTSGIAIKTSANETAAADPPARLPESRSVSAVSIALTVVGTLLGAAIVVGSVFICVAGRTMKQRVLAASKYTPLDDMADDAHFLQATSLGGEV